LYEAPKCPARTEWESEGWWSTEWGMLMGSAAGSKSGWWQWLVSDVGWLVGKGQAEDIEEEEERRRQKDEELVACVKYALGLEGGGGVHEGEGAAPQEGMVKEVFVELCEMLTPTWARADM
jgi:hypothetical protein